MQSVTAKLMSPNAQLAETEVWTEREDAEGEWSVHFTPVRSGYATTAYLGSRQADVEAVPVLAGVPVTLKLTVPSSDAATTA